MLDLDLLASIATQMTKGRRVQVRGKRIPVRHIGAHHLKAVSFEMNGRQYTAIEQNPEKPSRWGQLARDGHQVVQFKDNRANRFVAVSVDGKLKEYGSFRRKNSSR